ncbi:hypothetical protein AALA99_10320 [Anaerotruncus colihominis]|uniref:hypothetical protein n=1 Tax=Anaerotruncus colihominis TaxID=169435 RepID=UPI003516A3B2
MSDHLHIADQASSTAQESTQTTAPKSGAGSDSRHTQRMDERPVRRVGTLTMGIALIVSGVVALLCMFLPSFNLLFVLKFSPLIFVFLGLEVLYASVFRRGERIKYDLLSCFVCFLLICGAIGLAAVPFVWKYAGPPAMQARDQLKQQVEDHIYNAISDRSHISNMYVGCELPYYYEYTPDMDYASLTSQMSTYLHFSLNGPYENQETFAANAAAILADIKPLDLHTRNITFNYSDDNVSYSLDVNGRFQLEQSAAALAQNVEVHSYRNDDAENVFDAMEIPEDVSAEAFEEILADLSTINRPDDAMAFFEHYETAANEGVGMVSTDMSLSDANIPYLLFQIDGAPAQAIFSASPSSGSYLSIVYIALDGTETNLYEQRSGFDSDSFTISASLPAGYGRMEFRGDVQMHMELRVEPASDGSVLIIPQ